MNMRDVGRERGREAARSIGDQSSAAMDEAFRYARELHPTLGDVDMGAMVRDYDRERLACEPDYTQFPEMKGLIDQHVGEREAFADAGIDETLAAYHFSWNWLLTRRRSWIGSSIPDCASSWQNRCIRISVSVSRAR